MRRMVAASQNTDPRTGRLLLGIVGIGLAIQLFVRYWGQSSELQVDGFYWATAIARIAVPALAIALLGLRFDGFGLGIPRIPRREGLWLLGAAAVSIAIVWIALQSEDYRAAYQGARYGDFGTKLTRWTLFTLSTTVPWEILHRGFLLHGIRHVLVRAKLPESSADAIAIGFVTCFEVLYHLIKPVLEAGALLVGSPILSYLAFRYRSLWLPLVIHVAIEGLWFAAVWF